MQRSFCLAAVAALFLAPALLRADDAYTIKRKPVAQGDVYDVQATASMNMAIKVTSPEGNALRDDKVEIVVKAVFKETIVKCEPNLPPTLIERKYEKAQMTTNGKAEDAPYHGKTLVIEKKDGKFLFTVDGKELTGDDAKTLAVEFDRGETTIDKDILPKGPVKLNETWKMELEPFLKLLPANKDWEADTDKAKNTASLLKAYKKDEHQFGELKATINVPFKTRAKALVQGQEGSNMTMEFSMDGCIDGTVNTVTMKSVMKMELKATLPSPLGGSGQINMSLEIKGEEVRKELPKK